MTMTSSVFGATFYLLIGSHGLHVLGGVLGMIGLYNHFRKCGMETSYVAAMQIFWYLVVGVWPILYGLVFTHLSHTIDRRRGIEFYVSMVTHVLCIDVLEAFTFLLFES